MAATHGYPHDYPAQKARGGDIVLRRPWQRIVFMAGLFGGIIVLLLWAVMRAL